MSDREDHPNPLENLNENPDTQMLMAAGKADALAGVPRDDQAGSPHAYLESKTRLRTVYQERFTRCQDELNSIENLVHEQENIFEPEKVVHRGWQILQSLSDAATHSRFRANMRHHRNLFDKAKLDLQRFRLEFDRTYLPIRGTSVSVLPVGIATATLCLIVLYLAESLFNAFLFIEGTGLLGGLTISLVASLFNVVMGYIVGRYVLTKSFYSRETITRVGASFLFAGFLFLISWLNFAIAVFRALEQKSGEDFTFVTNTSQAVWPFTSLGVLDFESALLIVAGLVFATLALMDGWFSDDPFPGYGQKYRACMKEKASIDHELRAYKKELRKEVLLARNAINEIQPNAQQAIHRWARLINTVQQRFTDFPVWVQNLNDRNRANWRTYMTAHQNNRLQGYLAPSVLTTPPDALFSEQQAEPESVFRDAAQLYMDDKERLERADRHQQKFQEVYGKIQNLLKTKETELGDDLSQLEKDAGALL